MISTVDRSTVVLNYVVYTVKNFNKITDFPYLKITLKYCDLKKKKKKNKRSACKN